MKNKDEFRQDVYRRFDEYKKNKEVKRKNVLKYGTVAVSALAVVALFIWPGIGLVDTVFGPNAVDIGVDTATTAQFSLNTTDMSGDITGAVTSEISDGAATTEATIATTEATIATTEATVATTEATAEMTVEETTAATTSANTLSSTEEATVEETTAVYEETTESTAEETAASSIVWTEAETTASGDGTLWHFFSQYAVAVEGVELVDRSYIPKDNKELNALVNELAPICDGILSYHGGEKSTFAYLFTLRGTAKIGYVESQIDGNTVRKYVIEVSPGDEYNMYICFFDSYLTAEINIVK